ncbi:NAD-dependent epimerase/dehydratase family protein [Crocinitomicaceae bacterium]|nr:NAD-dependent epimerase/dehydratase family protein [Crocinitomicaceae bacterium]|tara:strand:- start:1555 stop:2610 length:1056 start_codon:yes stop_codon:yes gene_type:complete
MNFIDTNKPVLVTGATGYVAGRLVEKLLTEGFIVHAAVRTPNDKDKTQYLDALAAKLPGEIKYFKSDLLEEGSYDEAMKGCELVFHTASPFIRVIKDPQKDLVDPAKKGTKNVLGSANKTESVKRVVVTSSCAAIYGDGVDVLEMPNQELTEDLWNTSSSLDHQPYSFSKTVAEKEAWEVNKAQDRWDLVTINPSFVLGPGINPHASSESYSIMKQIGKGDFKMGAPEFNIGCIDVRDLAEAHFQAGTKAEAKGRYIISGTNSGFLEIAGFIKNKFPNYKIGTKKLPKWMLWLMAPSVGMTRKEVSKNVGFPWKANNSKSIKDLGMKYRPLEGTVTEFFGQLVEAGEIPKI